ncbi:MAG: antitermination protein NusB [Actinobacteria bacterium]|nr:MAG: antitermination protein NusB [Actinomycetota bacterium]
MPHHGRRPPADRDRRRAGRCGRAPGPRGPAADRRGSRSRRWRGRPHRGQARGTLHDVRGRVGERCPSAARGRLGPRVTAASSARALALSVLTRVRERDAYASEVLDAQLARRPVSAADAALAHRIVFGVLQMQGTLDAVLDRYVERPSALEPRVRDALRIAAYELLFSRVPARAAVSEGVELARVARPAASGLANAVLRRLAAEAASFPWADRSDPAVLALATGHPRWIVDDLVAQFGRDAAERVLDADNTPAPFYLAVNPFRGTAEAAFEALAAEGADPAPGPLPGCIVCGVPSAAVRSRAVSDGLVLVADAAAQVVAWLVGAHPGGTIVDVAAGRGTKTVLMQARAAGAGTPAHITAVDLHEYKARILAERTDALGVPCVTALAGDATDLAGIDGVPAAGTADAVLVDAPCTGLGTLRRHPERRWRVSPDDAARLAALGARLLASASRLVRVGGVVVYSTCTLTATENDDVVGAFLASEAGFRVRDVGGSLPEGWNGRVTPEGYFQSLPEQGGPDGHFAAVLERIS